jgi:HEAT repeat protein
MATPKPDVAALVEKMPETDRDLQTAKEEAQRSAQPGPGAAARPVHTHTASKFTGPDPAVAAEIFSAILAGGQDALVELLGLVRDPADPDYTSYKAGYVLHGLVLSVGRTGQEAPRRLLLDALIAALGRPQYSKPVQGFFIRELRILGDATAVDALGAHLLDEQLGGDAAQALLTIREGSTPQFRRALGQAKGNVRVTLIQALGVLRDAESVEALRKFLPDPDGTVARRAAWALANIGDAGSAESLLQVADQAAGWERTEATGHCLLLAERLAETGKKAPARRIYEHLRDTRTGDAERHIRATATAALSALGQ